MSQQERNQLLHLWLSEYHYPFAGWDFSHLAGRMIEDHTLPWDYRATVCSYLNTAQSLLDMGTGGGEFLASLQSLPPAVYATEGYPPNIPVARQRLEQADGNLHVSSHRFFIVAQKP